MFTLVVYGPRIGRQLGMARRGAMSLVCVGGCVGIDLCVCRRVGIGVHVCLAM